MNQPLEIERKYLIAYPDTEALRPRCTAVYDMEQTYLLSAPNVTARVRRRVGEKEEFFHTEKERITARTHVERERTVTREEYEQLLTTRDPAAFTICKTRYCLPHEGFTFEIDVYPSGRTWRSWRWNWKEKSRNSLCPRGSPLSVR